MLSDHICVSPAALLESPINWVTALLCQRAEGRDLLLILFYLTKSFMPVFHLIAVCFFQTSPPAGSSGSNCSKNEGPKSGGSGSETELRSHRAPSERSLAPPSERSIRSSVSHRSANPHSLAYGPGLVYGPPGLPPQLPHLSTAAPGAPPGRELASVPPELTASRQSLRLAVGNAGEFFVDVM